MAIQCFYQVKAYDLILSLPLVNLCFAKIGGISFEIIARDLLSSCPEDILLAHPISLLRLAYFLFEATDFEGYHLAMVLAKKAAQQGEDVRLLGEWQVMDALSVYPDIVAMGQKWKAAYEILGGPCQVIDQKEPFMFGCQSMWFMFYTKSGQAEETACALCEAMSWYNRLTRGHALGAEVLFQAEIKSLKGDYDEARTLAYQAGHLALYAAQPTLTYGVALLLGRIAISRQDMPGLREAIDFLENKAKTYPFMQGSAMNDYLLDVTRTMLRSMMLEHDKAAPWALCGLQKEESLGISTLMTKHAHVTFILMGGEYQKALGLMEAFLTQDERLMNVVMAYYVYVGMAVCCLALKMRDKALFYLDKAMAIAQADALISVFVHYRDVLKPLLNSPALKAKYAGLIKKVLAVKRGFSGGTLLQIKGVGTTDNLPDTLTQREREIALLAAQGLRNREIAKRAFISEQTVKNHMKSIFEKLSIDRRSKLSDLLKP